MRADILRLGPLLMGLTAPAVAATSAAQPVYWDGGPVVVVNATDRVRSYMLVDAGHHVAITRRFTLPSGGICRIDTGLYLQRPNTDDGPAYFRAASHDRLIGEVAGQYVEDVSEGHVGVMNGPLLRYPGSSCTACSNDESDIRELLACSAVAESRCAGQFWAAWQIGLLVPQRQTLDYRCGFGVFSPQCTLDLVPNRVYAPRTEWGQVDDRSPSVYALRYHTQWPKALVMIQGAIGEQPVDPNRLTQMRSEDAFEAQLCSELPARLHRAPPQAAPRN